MNIDTLLVGEIVEDDKGNVRRDFGLGNLVVWGLIIASMGWRLRGRRQKGGSGEREKAGKMGFMQQIFIGLGIAVIFIIIVVLFFVIVLKKNPEDWLRPASRRNSSE